MERRRFYQIQSDKSGEKWFVVLDLGSNPIVSDIEDSDVAQEIADALNSAYELGLFDCENQVKEKINRLLFE